MPRANRSAAASTTRCRAREAHHLEPGHRRLDRLGERDLAGMRGAEARSERGLRRDGVADGRRGVPQGVRAPAADVVEWRLPSTS